ncbi:MAG: SDR family oxidoreductase [Moraxellaceae bacterium]|nr:SDR family oxidoreductase [Moraxellaceae bacterium]MDP1776172.1 SDR family oxidoreductase [Moraxellaceae bacterium]
MTSWQGKTIFMTGGSRGIGRAIALKMAAQGANIVIAAKTASPHPRLAGTVHSVAEEVRAAGGRCLPLVVDARDEAQLVNAVAEAVEFFGGIDVLINNAGFLGLTPIADTSTKTYDLMQALNTRSPFITMRECLPHLQASRGAVLNLCPPINLDPGWMGAFAPYTVSKYGMTLLSMGYAEETRRHGIQVATLWPKTIIATDAVGAKMGDVGLSLSRKADIMADAAELLLNQRDRFQHQLSWLDEGVLRANGVTDFDQYAFDPAKADQIQRDFYIGTF